MKANPTPTTIAELTEQSNSGFLWKIILRRAVDENYDGSDVEINFSDIINVSNLIEEVESTTLANWITGDVVLHVIKGKLVNTDENGILENLTSETTVNALLLVGAVKATDVISMLEGEVDFEEIEVDVKDDLVRFKILSFDSIAQTTPAEVVSELQHATTQPDGVLSNISGVYNINAATWNDEKVGVITFTFLGAGSNTLRIDDGGDVVIPGDGTYLLYDKYRTQYISVYVDESGLPPIDNWTNDIVFREISDVMRFATWYEDLTYKEIVEYCYTALGLDLDNCFIDEDGLLPFYSSVYEDSKSPFAVLRPPRDGTQREAQAIVIDEDIGRSYFAIGNEIHYSDDDGLNYTLSKALAYTGDIGDIGEGFDLGQGHSYGNILNMHFWNDVTNSKKYIIGIQSKYFRSDDARYVNPVTGWELALMDRGGVIFIFNITDDLLVEFDDEYAYRGTYQGRRPVTARLALDGGSGWNETERQYFRCFVNNTEATFAWWRVPLGQEYGTDWAALQRNHRYVRPSTDLAPSPVEVATLKDAGGWFSTIPIRTVTDENDIEYLDKNNGVLVHPHRCNDHEYSIARGNLDYSAGDKWSVDVSGLNRDFPFSNLPTSGFQSLLDVTFDDTNQYIYLSFATALSMKPAESGNEGRWMGRIKGEIFKWEYGKPSNVDYIKCIYANQCSPNYLTYNNERMPRGYIFRSIKYTTIGSREGILAIAEAPYCDTPSDVGWEGGAETVSLDWKIVFIPFNSSGDIIKPQILQGSDVSRLFCGGDPKFDNYGTAGIDERIFKDIAKIISSPSEPTFSPRLWNIIQNTNPIRDGERDLYFVENQPLRSTPNDACKVGEAKFADKFPDWEEVYNDNFKDGPTKFVGIDEDANLSCLFKVADVYTKFPNDEVTIANWDFCDSEPRYVIDYWTGGKTVQTHGDYPNSVSGLYRLFSRQWDSPPSRVEEEGQIGVTFDNTKYEALSTYRYKDTITNELTNARMTSYYGQFKLTAAELFEVDGFHLQAFISFQGLNAGKIFVFGSMEYWGIPADEETAVNWVVYIYLDGAQKVNFRVYYDDGTTTTVQTSALAANIAYNFVFEHKRNGTQRIYVDGSIDGTMAASDKAYRVTEQSTLQFRWGSIVNCSNFHLVAAKISRGFGLVTPADYYNNATLTDSSSNGLDFTWSSVAALNYEWEGLFRAAMKFNGATYLTRASHADLQIGAVVTTIGFAFKRVTGAGIGSGQMIITKGRIADNDAEWAVYFDSRNKIRVVLSLDGLAWAWQCPGLTSFTADNNWHTGVVVIDPIAVTGSITILADGADDTGITAGAPGNLHTGAGGIGIGGTATGAALLRNSHLIDQLFVIKGTQWDATEALNYHNSIGSCYDNYWLGGSQRLEPKRVGLWSNTVAGNSIIEKKIIVPGDCEYLALNSIISIGLPNLGSNVLNDGDCYLEMQIIDSLSNIVVRSRITAQLMRPAGRSSTNFRFVSRFGVYWDDSLIPALVDTGIEMDSFINTPRYANLLLALDLANSKFAFEGGGKLVPNDSATGNVKKDWTAFLAGSIAAGDTITLKFTWFQMPNPVLDIFPMFTIQDFNVTSIKDLDLWDNNDSGTATGAQTDSTLKDTGKVWGVNEWTGYLVTLTLNEGVRQSREVISNTIDTLTISDGTDNAEWTTTPAAGSTQYEIEAFSTRDPVQLIKGSEKRVVPDLVINNKPEGKDPDDTGTASAGGVGTLTDGTKAWTNDEWNNRYAVLIIAGTGIGQWRGITDNNGTVLTISPNWTTNPDATSEYIIKKKRDRTIGSLVTYSDEIFWYSDTYAFTVTECDFEGESIASLLSACAMNTYKVNRFRPSPSDWGYATAGGATTLSDTAKSWVVNVFASATIMVISGTGEGEVNTIASNTDTVITVSGAWGTNPDNTSTYVIIPYGGKVRGWMMDRNTNIEGGDRNIYKSDILNKGILVNEVWDKWYDGVVVGWNDGTVSGTEYIGDTRRGKKVLTVSNPLIQDAYIAKSIAQMIYNNLSAKKRILKDFYTIPLLTPEPMDRVRPYVLSLRRDNAYLWYNIYKLDTSLKGGICKMEIVQQ